MIYSEVRYHAVLIGIDAYPTKPLRGCVNDIDAVQRLLIERAGVPKENVRRLASPHPEEAHETAVPGEPATLANIRAVLGALPEQVREGDRVFIYYSGHGLRAPVELPGGRTFHRESLVPVDVTAAAEPRLLFDHELNALLAAVAARTRSVTCVLDCCHSAGATRDPGLHGATARCLDPREDLGWTSPLREPAAARGDGEPRNDGIVRTVDDCHVVSACLNHELAVEAVGDDGKRHGLLTRAFLQALAAITDQELRTVRWSHVWQAMRASVERRNPWQHLWMAGNPARAVLAGPPVDGDPGLTIRRGDDGAYEIDAGTLASVTEDALLAVYGERPPHFPALGSPQDAEARRGLLRVTRAQLASASAKLEGAPFELPAGARGRLVEPGRAARLRCVVVPRDEQLAAALAPSPLLELVDDPKAARVWLERLDDRWLLHDDVHESNPDGALLVLHRADLEHVREVLEHYYQYALPLRMAESVQDLPGALELSVLACDHELPPGAAQEANLPEAQTVGTSRYDLQSGARVCFRVRNTSHERLRVTLLNSAASGRVQILGDQVIDAASAYTFWAGNALGKPFAMTLPPGKQQGIDRLTAVGTTGMGRDLGYLRVGRRFADILAIMRGEVRDTVKDIGDDSDERNSPPVEQWTAAQVIVRTRAK